MAAEKHTPAERHSFHRSMAHLNAGALHRHLGIKEGEPIPESKLAEAENSENAHVRRMANFARVAHSWHHGKK